jgi:hypothetical protein
MALPGPLAEAVPLLERATSLTSRLVRMNNPRPVGVVIVSGALSAIPTVGGPLQTMFDAFIERRRHRVELTAREIAEAVGEDRMTSRVLEDPRLETMLGEALEAAARSGFEAKRRLLARAVGQAILDDAVVDPATLMVHALAQLETVHVRALTLLERAVGPSGEVFTDRTAVDEFNHSQPAPVLATLETTGTIIPATSWTGRGLGAESISEFGRHVLSELRAVAEEEMERLVD